MTFHDRFSEVSAEYAEWRPRYPDVLFDFLATVANRHGAAWDCATGNGQAAVGLARHFGRVTATDASQQQLAHAVANARVVYTVAPAEASGLPTQSVDLVTVAQAAHWLDRHAFYAEARRVLRPGGVVAIWCYGDVSIDPELDPVLRAFSESTVGPYWPPERQLVRDGYRTIDFPFEEIDAPDFTIEQRLTLDSLAGYIRTWSATQRFIERHGRDPVDTLIRELEPLWGDATRKRLARWPIGLRVGRV